MRTLALYLVAVLLGFLSLAAFGWPDKGWLPASQAAPIEPAVYSSPINAGCVQVTPSVCRLHVDPFTINLVTGQRLQAFQLLANGQPLYDFRTDVSNPPVGNYTASPTMLDFAATCGQTYTINLLARDSGDASFLNAGSAGPVVCPAGMHSIYLPLVLR